MSHTTRTPTHTRTHTRTHPRTHARSCTRTHTTQHTTHTLALVHTRVLVHSHRAHRHRAQAHPRTRTHGQMYVRHGRQACMERDGGWAALIHRLLALAEPGRRLLQVSSTLSKRPCVVPCPFVPACSSLFIVPCGTAPWMRSVSAAHTAKTMTSRRSTRSR